MAVAPATVEMGPRNRRRLTTGAVTLVALVSVVVFGLWFFGGLPFVNSTNHTEASGPSVILPIPMRPGLPYGMTKQQMIHRLGRPQKIAGQCWQYPQNFKDLGGETINAVRMCFWNDRYQHWYIERDGKWGDFYKPNSVIAPPTKP